MTDDLVRDADAADAAQPSGRTASATGRPALPLAGGWVSQALVLVMLLAAGMAIHDLRPAGLPAGAGATSWLPLLMVAAGLMGRCPRGDAACAPAGWTSSRRSWARSWACVVVAGVISDAPSLTDRLRALEASVVGAVRDLLVERVPSDEVSPVLLTLSALAWTTGAFAAISVGRYARASGAIVPVGLMLLVPVILAEIQGQDGGQLLWLTIGVTAALLLVLRLNLERQRVRWLRRHVTGGRSVGRAFLGGGAVLVSAVTVGAVGLTAVVGSAPLQAGWERLGGVLTDLGVDVGQLRQQATDVGGEFPDAMPLDDHWTPRNVTYFTASTTAQRVYWRATTYDRFDGHAWHRSPGEGVDMAANDDLLGATADDASVDTDGFREVDATITFQDMRRGSARGSPEPVRGGPRDADRDAGRGGWAVPGPAAARRDAAWGHLCAWWPMSRTSSRAARRPSPRRCCGEAPTTPHPTGWRPTSSSPRRAWASSRATRRRRSRKTLPRRQQDDRYQLARAVQDHLTSAPFRYDTDIKGLCRPEQTPTDCLLEYHRGFCEQYATTMVMLLRKLEVPARYVVGFLPGLEVSPGEFEVGGGAAHAWVEVWFDGFGWVRFDPTPGATAEGNALEANGQVQTELPAGDETSPDPGPDGSFGPDESLGPDETFAPDESEGPSPEPSLAPGVTTAGSGIRRAVRGVGGGGSGGRPPRPHRRLVLLWFRRLPSGGPERAWGGITSIATRFGRGPRPRRPPTSTASRCPGWCRGWPRTSGPWPTPRSPRPMARTTRAPRRSPRSGRHTRGPGPDCSRSCSAGARAPRAPRHASRRGRRDAPRGCALAAVPARRAAR